MPEPSPIAISAHRRASAGGFAAAARCGAEYVELDVRRTGDGALVVQHDERVAGLAVRDRSYEQICAAAGRRLPLVADALGAIAGRARGHLDLKEPGCEREAVALALELLGPGNLVVTTRSAESIRLVRREFPEVPTALSVGRSLWERGAMRDFSPMALVRGCGAHMVAVNYRLARLGVLRQCAAAGLPAMVWTVNDDPLIRRFLGDPRVAVLITDHPERALALRAALTAAREAG